MLYSRTEGEAELQGAGQRRELLDESAGECSSHTCATSLWPMYSWTQLCDAAQDTSFSWIDTLGRAGIGPQP